MFVTSCLTLHRSFSGDKSFLPDMTILQQLAPDLCSLLPSGCNIFLELLCGPV
jgi:hypothetical protein